MGHTDLARRVAGELGIAPLAWNAQAVTSSFERSRGKRAVGQRVGANGFVAGASRTIAAPAERVFMAFVDPSHRSGWLPGVELSQRSVSKPKRARFDVGDGTARLLVTVEAKGPTKATVAIEHSRLIDGDAREEARSLWGTALSRLKADLEHDAATTRKVSR
jgi:hypothetical protein